MASSSSSAAGFTKLKAAEEDDEVDEEEYTDGEQVFNDIKFPPRTKDRKAADKKPKAYKHQPLATSPSKSNDDNESDADDHQDFNIALSYADDDDSSAEGHEDELDGYQKYLRTLSATFKSRDYPGRAEDEFEEEMFHSEVRKRRRRRVFLTVAILTSFLVLAMVVYAIPTVGGGITRLSGNTNSAVMSVLSDITNTPNIKKDGTQGQKQALTWLMQDPFMDAFLRLGPNAEYEGEPIQQAIRGRYALATIYCSTGGPSGETHKSSGSGGGWKDDTNWLSQYHVCDWNGVTCGEGRKITQLRLVGNELRGVLPYEIGALGDSLAKLDLSHNELSGQLPSEGISKLGKLTDLRLSNNHIGGTLDPTMLTSLHKIEVIVLDDNNFGGEIPKVFGQMQSLFLLRLSNNHFLGSLPIEIGNLSRLFEIDFSKNALDGHIPEQWGQLSQLQELRLSSNALFGPIPTTFSNLNELVQLRLDDNALSGELSSALVQRWNSLKGLYLDNNALEGIIPQELSGLVELQELTLEENKFTGQFPQGICGLSPRLLSADCELNCICCTVNNCIPGGGGMYGNGGGGVNGQLDGTKGGGKGDGSGRGDDDDEFTESALAVVAGISPTSSFHQHGSPQSMALKWVQDDKVYELYSKTPKDEVLTKQYQGTALVDAVKYRYAMAVLYYSTGGSPWPSSSQGVWGGTENGVGATTTTGWKVAKNWLTEYSLCDWHGVTCSQDHKILRLDLEDNGLAGALPDEIGAIPTLEAIDLRKNHVTGPIPTGLSSLTDLQELQLHENLFTGSMPQVICDMDNLQVLSADCFNGADEVECSCCTLCFNGN